jgi:hypothetical protein
MRTGRAQAAVTVLLFTASVGVTVWTITGARDWMLGGFLSLMILIGVIADGR